MNNHCHPLYLFFRGQICDAVNSVYHVLLLQSSAEQYDNILVKSRYLFLIPSNF